MSQNIFDPKLYKHVRSDKHSTTLKHKKGHTLTIAHNVISPKMRTALEALSKIPLEAATEGQRQEEQDSDQYGKILHKADGGVMENDPDKAAAVADVERGSDQTSQPSSNSRPMATRPSQSSAHGDDEWPSPSQTSVGHRHANGGKVHETTRKQIEAAKRLYPEPSPEHKKQRDERNKTMDEFMRNTAGKPMKVEYNEGGKINSKGISEQGRDVRHAKRQSDPKEIELAKHFAREEAKGRADFERTAVKPKMKGLADGGPVMMAKGGRMKSEIAGLPDWFHSAGEQAEAGYTNPDYASKGPGSEANFAYEHGLPCRNPNCKSHGRPHPNCRCYSFAEGGKVQHVCGMSLGHYPDCEHYTQPRKMAEGGQAVPYGMDEHDMPKDEAQTEHEMDQYDAQHPSRVEQSNNERMQARQPSPMLQPGMPGADEQHEPIDDTEDPPTGSEADTDPRMYAKIHNGDQYGRMPAQQEQAQQPANPGADTVEPGSDTVDMGPQPQLDPAQHQQEILKEDQAFGQDLMNGHITPKTYGDLMYHNRDGSEKSTLGKIGSIFGLILSGIGSGLTHQPNMAMQMMDNAIKNDLESQMKSKDNAQNFIKINQQRLLNEAQIPKLVAEGRMTEAQADLATTQASKLSYELGNMQANRAALQHMVELTKTLPPDQRPQAEQALAFISNKVDNENFSISDRAAAAQAVFHAITNGALLGSGTGDASANKNQTRAMRMMGDEKIGKEADVMERRRIGGIDGEASRDIEGHDRDSMEKHMQLESNLKDLKQNLSKLTTLNHYSPDYITLQGKISKLQSDIRSSQLGTVYKPSEQQLLDNTLKIPASKLTEYQTLNQVNQLLDSNTRDFNTLKKSYDLPVFKDGKDGKRYRETTVRGKTYYIPVK